MRSLARSSIVALAAITAKPVQFVLNTHWHGDHTGGNERFAEAGALIVAHDNVRKRMSTEQFLAFFNMRVEPSPKAALPLVTFSTDVTFHINGDEVTALHCPAAHTDGDAIVHFRRARRHPHGRHPLQLHVPVHRQRRAAAAPTA